MSEERRSAGGVDYTLVVKAVKNLNLRLRADWIAAQGMLC